MAAIALVVLAPVMLAVTLAVLSRLGRPVLFRQTRIGRNERPFTVLKFRSMRTGSDADAERLDRFGELLRSWSLDELPQLVNVIRGDMSIVGPRPLLPEYLPRYSERQARRHDVRPGLTGAAQVSGRNALDWESRLEIDACYAASWKLSTDFRILVDTIVTLIGRRGIAADGVATMPEFTGQARSVDESPTAP